MALFMLFILTTVEILLTAVNVIKAILKAFIYVKAIFQQ